MGSEMCIRDRAIGAQARVRVLAPVQHLVDQIEADQPGDVGQTDRCLLYTSDAADERSSVDLGGRRIIKKKKHDL